MKQSAIIAYDIVDNKKRRKVFRCLQSWKLSSQYSVFECQLNKKQAEELLLQLCDMIDEKKDKLLFIWLDTHQDPQALTQRAAINFKKPAHYLG